MNCCSEAQRRDVQWQHQEVQIAQHAGKHAWSGLNRSLLLTESRICLKCRGRKGHIKMNFVIVSQPQGVCAKVQLMCVTGPLLPGTKRKSLTTRRERCSYPHALTSVQFWRYSISAICPSPQKTIMKCFVCYLVETKSLLHLIL